ncbi:MAG: ABC transporter permease subunit [Candidatus Limnocylindrales bacterium]|jgi:ABC-2 type transport system permease protein
MSSIAAIPEIARITLRQLLGRRRTLLLVLLAALPVLLALAFRVAGDTDIEPFTRRVFDTVSLTILLPLVAILFGSGAFGAEIDEGTIVYLLAKPLSRWAVVAGKALSAVAVAILLTATSTALAGFIDLVPAGNDGVLATEAQVLAMVVGSACYVSLFLALSLFTRRALVIGVGYMLVWEGALSVMLPGIANLSIRQYALGASAAIYSLPVEEARLSAATGFLLAGVLVAATLAIATWRLMRFELPGGSD